VPIVAFGRQLAGERMQGFCLDNYAGACEAMDYLVQQGHRRIAFITGPADHADACARLAGYYDTLTRHRIEIRFASTSLPLFPLLSFYYPEHLAKKIACN
jgi:LacI family transcriptional regulator